MPDSTSKDTGSSILRALNILEIVANTPQPLTPAEINRTLKLPKPTIHRLCSQLEDAGFLQPRLDGRGLLPGPKLNKIALGVLSNNDFLRTQRHVILQRLSEKLGETCNISIPSGGEMIYFDRVETHWPLRVQLQINDRVPLHCTASGKLFLSELSSIKRSRLLARLPLDKHTPNTLTSAEALKPELRKIRQNGVGVDNEEFLQGMIAVAVPIRDSEGRLYAALAMHAPTARLSLEQAQEHVPAIRQAAAELALLMDEEQTDASADDDA
ncbi:IclR family transcriptional regulator [Marinobacterium rhizophilum]|uniref:IclR family transcriptional regulator n=1 Tax=Marinobacterium rhizophilum TaxID=420402 RepID=A0ABY5HIS6_9GAMM|nr:IclR family transcriptional regulator [Marinobacterium rhizophilum]UTW11849.1 IclR family transcriptional regulator [Marinobacterium rhizophilum]